MALDTRPSAARRGYDRKHRRFRAVLEERVAAGGVHCWRCGKLIEPGTPWDLGHDDHDRSRYRGPEHAACNRATYRRSSASSDPAPRVTRWWATPAN